MRADLFEARLCVAKDELVGALCVLEEVGDAVELTEAGDEREIGLFVLNDELSLWIAPDEAELEVVFPRELEPRELLREDLGDRFVEEDLVRLDEAEPEGARDELHSKRAGLCGLVRSRIHRLVDLRDDAVHDALLEAVALEHERGATPEHLGREL